MSVDARHAKLERYLKNGQWKKADDETYRLMITEVGKDEGQWFDQEDLLNFPCEPLRVIDGLWVKHSSGKFGFSVRKTMYLECGGIPDGKYHTRAWIKMCQMNGWNSSINYDISSPRGHLLAKVYYRGPAGNPLELKTFGAMLLGNSGLLLLSGAEWRELRGGVSLLYRLVNCNL